MRINFLIIFIFVSCFIISLFTIANLSAIDLFFQSLSCDDEIDNMCSAIFYLYDVQYIQVIVGLVFAISGVMIFIIRLIQHKWDTAEDSSPTNQTKQ